MSEPVLVIHGSRIRNARKFSERVAALNKAVGNKWNLIPVYWGDLGGHDEHLFDIMPSYEALDSVLRVVPLPEFVESLSNAITKQIREHWLKVQQIPRALVTQYALLLGDAIIYQGHEGSKRIQQRIRESVPKGYGTKSRPISVIAHSLGGVIAFDMAVGKSKRSYVVDRESPNRGRLWIRNFVTLGSQASFFHVQDPRNLEEYSRGRLVRLPKTIRSWTNIWDKHDVFAFGIINVFILHNGSHPVEVPVRQYKSWTDGIFGSHGRYLEDTDVREAIRQALSR